MNVPVRFAGPVKTAATGGFQVVERHLYVQADSKRLVAFYPSKRFGLFAHEREFWNGESAPQAEPIRFADPGSTPGGTLYVDSMSRRCPSDMREWSTRLWGEVESAERLSLHDLSTRQKYQSGARLAGLRFHPGQSDLFDRAFRGLWNAAWAARGLDHESDPAIMSLRVSVKDRSFRRCVSREVAGADYAPNFQSAHVV